MMIGGAALVTAALGLNAAPRHQISRRHAIFGSSEPPPIDWRDARVLILGLDRAGKTSIVRRAGDAKATLDEQIAPTRGFSVHTVAVMPVKHAPFMKTFLACRSPMRLS